MPAKNHFKMIGIAIQIPERAKAALERQGARTRHRLQSVAGQVFDMGFAAVCAREKSMPIADADSTPLSAEPCC